MGGERLEVATLGWHGLEGDRRLAFRRMDDRSGFPWLTAGRLPELVLFAPLRREDGAQGELPTHVRTPDGDELPVFGEDLAREVGRRYGAPVQMIGEPLRDRFRYGARDRTTRGAEPGRAAISPECRRPSAAIGDDAPAVTMRDARCSMVNLDPDSAHPAPEVLKAVVRANLNNAGAHGAVTRTGRLANRLVR